MKNLRDKLKTCWQFLKKKKKRENINQVLLIKSSDELITTVCVHFCKSCFSSVLVWCVQVSNTAPRRKDISNDLREATVSFHESGKASSFHRERFCASGKYLKQLHVFPGGDLPANSPRGRAVQCKEELHKVKCSVSDSTGLRWQVEG